MKQLKEAWLRNTPIYAGTQSYTTRYRQHMISSTKTSGLRNFCLARAGLDGEAEEDA